MGKAGGAIGEPLLAALLSELKHGGSLLVTGPAGSGKSHLLREASARFIREGRSVLELRAGTAGSAGALTEAAPEAIVCVDDLGASDADLLAACAARIAHGSPLLMTLTAGPRQTRTAQALADLVAAVPGGRGEWADVPQFAIQPLPPSELERLLHAQSDAPLDSSDCHTIVALAEGRPGWALDLLALAQHGELTSRPGPAILEVPRAALDLPTLRALEADLAELATESAIAAIALADLGPVDPSGAHDLVGATAMSELRGAGVLVTAADPELCVVPPFVAAALRPAVSADAITRWRRVIAERWLIQESLGIPLNNVETLLSARSFDTSPASDPLPVDRAARVRVLHRAIANLLDFPGAAQARTLILRAGALGAPLPALQQAQAICVLASPAAALTELATSPPVEGLSNRLLQQFLRAQFAAEAGSPLLTSDRRPRTADADADAIVSEASDVFRLWNTTSDISTDHLRLRRIAKATPSAEVSALAAALVDLDQVWNGMLPAGSWLALGGPVPHPHTQQSALGRAVDGPLLLAHALIAFLAGEQALRAPEFQTLARAIEPAEAHGRWLRHLLAAGTALACGNSVRAALEWTELEREVPRFIPVRLRDWLRDIGDAIRNSESPPGHQRTSGMGTLPEHLTRYLSGRHDGLVDAIPSSGNPRETLPIVRLARAHLTAAAEQNPSELLRAAARLLRLELWAPAAYALSVARMISLSRRAVRGVQHCDERLAELHASVSSTVAWFSPDDLPSVSNVRLTRRERETAGLAAEGLSNSEIAKQLGCSVRTVESHISQARAKLGAVRRQDLGPRLAQLGSAGYPEPRAGRERSPDPTPHAFDQSPRSRISPEYGEKPIFRI